MYSYDTHLPLRNLPNTFKLNGNTLETQCTYLNSLLIDLSEAREDLSLNDTLKDRCMQELLPHAHKASKHIFWILYIYIYMSCHLI